MTTDENNNENLKEDSQTDETTLEQDHKVAKKKGLGRRDTILLYSPVIIMASSFLLMMLGDSLGLSPIQDVMPTIELLAVLYCISLPVSLFILFNRVLNVRSYILSISITIVSGMIIGFCTCAVPVPSLVNAPRAAFENRSKLMLRALGAAQTTFAESNIGNYGTWQELIDQDFIEDGYTRDNIIEEYIITTFMVDNPSESERALGESSSFTITAKPKRTRNKLRTFGFGDDQIPYLFVGSAEDWSTENVSLHNIELWEPLR
jgi:hypothetical protein